MLLHYNEIVDYQVQGRDGSLGRVVDVYFDEVEWTVRYFVVRLGSWLFGRKVLVAPDAVRGIDPRDDKVVVDLTRDRIRSSPDVDFDRPVSRQQELVYRSYYGWAPYWVEQTAEPGRYVPARPAIHPAGTPPPDVLTGDPHLHSACEVLGYRVAAQDGPLGDVADYLLDDQSFAIRYILTRVGHGLSIEWALFASRWVDRIRWLDRSMRVKVTRAQVDRSPPFNPDAAPSREYEDRLHEHYADRPPDPDP